MKQLTPKQQLFIDEYLISLNATKAAEKAGFSSKTAYSQGQRLLKNVEIKNAIEKAMEERSMEAKRTAEDVFKDIVSVTESARNEGNYIVTLKGLELQGKHLGMFINKMEVSSPQPAMSPLEVMAELLRRRQEKDRG